MWSSQTLFNLFRCFRCPLYFGHRPRDDGRMTRTAVFHGWGSQCWTCVVNGLVRLPGIGLKQLSPWRTWKNWYVCVWAKSKSQCMFYLSLSFTLRRLLKLGLVYVSQHSICPFAWQPKLIHDPSCVWPGHISSFVPCFGYSPWPRGSYHWYPQLVVVFHRLRIQNKNVPSKCFIRTISRTSHLPPSLLLLHLLAIHNPEDKQCLIQLTWSCLNSRPESGMIFLF